MGRIVYAAAMSHVLHPPYYEKNVGPHGRRMVEDLMAVVAEMGRELAAREPEALVVIADDHLNVFSFDAVPAMCIRIGRSVQRMAQEGAIEFDRALDGPGRFRREAHRRSGASKIVLEPHERSACCLVVK